MRSTPSPATVPPAGGSPTRWWNGPSAACGWNCNCGTACGCSGPWNWTRKSHCSI